MTNGHIKDIRPSRTEGTVTNDENQKEVPFKGPELSPNFREGSAVTYEERTEGENTVATDLRIKD